MPQEARRPEGPQAPPTPKQEVVSMTTKAEALEWLRKNYGKACKTWAKQLIHEDKERHMMSIAYADSPHYP